MDCNACEQDFKDWCLGCTAYAHNAWHGSLFHDIGINCYHEEGKLRKAERLERENHQDTIQFVAGLLEKLN